MLLLGETFAQPALWHVPNVVPDFEEAFRPLWHKMLLNLSIIKKRQFWPLHRDGYGLSCLSSPLTNQALYIDPIGQFFLSWGRIPLLPADYFVCVVFWIFQPNLYIRIEYGYQPGRYNFPRSYQVDSIVHP